MCEGVEWSGVNKRMALLTERPSAEESLRAKANDIVDLAEGKFRVVFDDCGGRRIAEVQGYGPWPEGSRS